MYGPLEARHNRSNHSSGSKPYFWHSVMEGGGRFWLLCLLKVLLDFYALSWVMVWHDKAQVKRESADSQKAGSPLTLQQSLAITEAKRSPFLRRDEGEKPVGLSRHLRVRTHLLCTINSNITTTIGFFNLNLLAEFTKNIFPFIVTM